MAKASNHEFDWLVIILVYNNTTYKFEKKKDANYINMPFQKVSLFNAVKDSAFSKKIKIFIVEARIEDDEKTKKIQQSIFVLERKKAGSKGLLTVYTRRNTGNSELESAAGVAGIMRELVALNPARKHIVVTFGHGSFFGINYMPIGPTTSVPKDHNDDPRGHDTDNLGPERALIKNETDTIFTESSAVKYAVQKEKTNLSELTPGRNALNLLTAKELNDAFRDVYGHKKVDVLIMYNCIMQNLFTQYELRNTVDYLVAPVSGISHPGYHYREVLKALAQSPELSNQEVCDKIISSINQRVGNHFKYIGDIEQTWKVHAVQLDNTVFESIKNALAALMEEVYRLQQNDVTILQCLELAQRQLFNYGVYCLNSIKIVDLDVLLGYWLKKINRFKSSAPLIPFIIALRNELHKVNVAGRFTGKNFYKNGFSYVDQEVKPLGAIVGCCIWFPRLAATKFELFAKILKGSPEELVPSIIKGTRYSEVFTEMLGKLRR